MQKRLVNKNNKKNKVSATNLLVSSAFAATAVSMWGSWMSIGFDSIDVGDTPEVFMGLAVVSSGAVVPMAIVGGVIDYIREAKESEKSDSTKTTK